jgi:predicted nucleic acid-binding Zn finger protein
MSCILSIDLLDALCMANDKDSVDEKHILASCAFIMNDNRKLLEASLDIIDDHPTPVTAYVCGTYGKKCWTVKGSQGREYICLQEFCNCSHFLQQARHTTERIECKHLVCIRIATALRRVVEQEVSVEKFISVMCSSSNDHTTYAGSRHY